MKERKSLEWAELVPEQPDYRVINFALGKVGHSAFFDKAKDLVLSECKGTNKRGNHVRTYGPRYRGDRRRQTQRPKSADNKSARRNDGHRRNSRAHRQ